MKKLLRIKLPLIMLILLLLLSRANAKDTVYRTGFRVDRITCGGCLYTINRELKKLDGFIKMGASLFKGEVYVSHNGSLKAKVIEDVITKAGYPAKILSKNTFDMGKVEKKPEANKSYNSYSCTIPQKIKN